eukprot:TRINITY_DN59384_c0_g1_i1.p1 TRINITY_DN59384_c0_g1~~TRINITY_DN59384_c0_g1_i1.p1  ORF type:complete len:307 (-),score=39.85 TRINITY_DN59384_c0_g1_i1:86-1006(-)
MVESILSCLVGAGTYAATWYFDKEKKKKRHKLDRLERQVNVYGNIVGAMETAGQGLKSYRNQGWEQKLHSEWQDVVTKFAPNFHIDEKETLEKTIRRFPKEFIDVEDGFHEHMSRKSAVVAWRACVQGDILPTNESILEFVNKNLDLLPLGLTYTKEDLAPLLLHVRKRKPEKCQQRIEKLFFPESSSSQLPSGEVDKSQCFAQSLRAFRKYASASKSMAEAWKQGHWNSLLVPAEARYPVKFRVILEWKYEEAWEALAQETHKADRSEKGRGLGKQSEDQLPKTRRSAARCTGSACRRKRQASAS